MSDDTEQTQPTLEQMKQMRERLDTAIQAQDGEAQEAEFQTKMKSAGASEYRRLHRERYGYYPQV